VVKQENPTTNPSGGICAEREDRESTPPEQPHHETRSPIGSRFAAAGPPAPLLFFFASANHEIGGSIETNEKRCPLDSRRVERLSSADELQVISGM